MSIASASRPTYHVVGLLAEKPEILVISSELESAGVDVAAVRSCAVSLEQPFWMSMAATTGCQAASCEPFSSSATTKRPWRPTTRRCGTVTCCCMVRRARLTVAASWRCSSATRSTIWATSAGDVRAVPDLDTRLSPICPRTAGRFGGWDVQDQRRARQEGHTPRFTVIHGATGTATDLCNPQVPARPRRLAVRRWKERSVSALEPWPTVRRPARDASWTAGRAGQRGARWLSTT
jgi:hypothetical protein